MVFKNRNGNKEKFKAVAANDNCKNPRKSRKGFRYLATALTKTEQLAGWCVGVIRGCFIDIPIFITNEEFQDHQTKSELLKKFEEIVGEGTFVITLFLVANPENKSFARSHGYIFKRRTKENTEIYEKVLIRPPTLRFRVETLSQSIRGKR